MEGILVGWRMWKCFLGFKGIFDAGTYVVSPRVRWGFIHVSFSVQACRECHAAEGSRYTVANILCQQDSSRCRDKIFASKKLVLALVHATRKLSHYFQAHIVYVLTKYPLQSLLKRSNFTGRIAKWGTRLGSFDIRNRPGSSMKGQVLTDFVAEFSREGRWK